MAQLGALLNEAAHRPKKPTVILRAPALRPAILEAVTALTVPRVSAAFPPACLGDRCFSLRARGARRPKFPAARP